MLKTLYCGHNVFFVVNCNKNKLFSIYFFQQWKLIFLDLLFFKYEVYFRKAIIIINVKRHESAIPKTQHPLYRTEAVLDGSQMSNDNWLYDGFVYFRWPDTLPVANSW